MNRKLLFSLSFLITLSSLLVSINSAAQDQSQDDLPPVPEEATIASVPTLAEIIPLEIELTSRLTSLQAKMKDLLDISQVDNQFTDLEKSLDDLTVQLKQYNHTQDSRFSELLELDKLLDNNAESFEEISAPLLTAIEQLGDWQKEWLKEKNQWAKWQDSLMKETTLPQLEQAFKSADHTTETSLNLIISQLNVLLELQKKGYKNKMKLNLFEAEIDKMIEMHRQSLLKSRSAPLFSSMFFSQLSDGLWIDVKKGFYTMAWPDKKFFSSEFWVILMQLIITIFFIAFIYWKRPVIAKMKKYAFLAEHPVAAGLFLGVMATIVIYQVHKAPGSWNMIILIIGGISFARIVSAIKKHSWKNHFVYGIIILLVVTQFLDLASLPMPLYRIFLVLVSIFSSIFCFRWAYKNRKVKRDKYNSWWLYLLSAIFLVIIIAQIIGEESLAVYIYESTLRTIILILIFLMLMFLIRGGAEWLNGNIIYKPEETEKIDSESKINQILFFINSIIVIFIVIPVSLAIWGVFDNIQEANTGLMDIGFNLGTLRVSIGLFMTVAGILYGSYIISILIQSLILKRLFSVRHVDKGARLSINRLLNYLILFVGFILAVSALGFDITKLTIMLSALGVGIGFGLQGFVNNFVSGLILLFEQPVREGDSIQVGGVWSTIMKIGLRATRVKTVDEADVIIPNADLVYNQVTNWTLSNRHVRVIIPVGVAYGSDVPLVIETLNACAKANNRVIKRTDSQALFIGFGDSALNFELRVWASEVDDRIQLISDLHKDIDRRFREAKIEIAFPQLDVRIRSADKKSIHKEDPNK